MPSGIEDALEQAAFLWRQANLISLREVAAQHSFLFSQSWNRHIDNGVVYKKSRDQIDIILWEQVIEEIFALEDAEKVALQNSNYFSKALNILDINLGKSDDTFESSCWFDDQEPEYERIALWKGPSCSLRLSHRVSGLEQIEKIRLSLMNSSVECGQVKTR